MNKKLSLLVILSIAAILAISMIIAKPNNPHNQNNNSNLNNTNSSNQTIRNFGLCVSEAAHEKNNCFLEAKNNETSCINLSLSNILNQTNSTNNSTNLSKSEQKQLKRELRSQIIDAKHTCRDKYKEEKNQCKAEFKEDKIQCRPLKCKENQIFSNETNRCVKKDSASLGETCGGIAGIECIKGLKCDYAGNNYPDATGICIPKNQNSTNNTNNTNSTTNITNSS